MALEYEKVVDTLMNFGDKCTLEFIVSLAYNFKDDRKYYYSEYEYDGSIKYPDYHENLVSIHRRIRGYLAINDKQSGIRTIILRSMLGELQKVMETVDKWLSPKSKVYVYEENKLMVVGHRQEVLPFPDGYGLLFEPIVVNEDGLYNMGVRIYLNDSSNWMDIGIEKFKEFLIIVQKIDYYQAALAVINSIPMEERDRLANRVHMGEDQPMRQSLFKNNGKKRGSGFFNKGE